MFAIIFLFIFQDPEIPDFYSEIFSTGFLQSMMVVIGATKILRNFGNIKGKWALVITGVVSLGYSLITNYADMGLVQAALVGLAAFGASAGIFRGSKVTGKTVNPGGTK